VTFFDGAGGDYRFGFARLSIVTPMGAAAYACLPMAACHNLCTALSLDCSRPWAYSKQTRAFLCGATAPFRDAERSGAGVFPGRRGHTLEVAMSALLNDYLPLVVFIAVALVIGLALLVAPFLVAYRQPDPEKLSAYECGFNAFDDARMKFDVRFYLVAILFIIFDLEVSFLFPWAVAFREIGLYGFWAMMLFLGVLTVGVIYEWKKWALEWD
jgi:NADH-quinone oxidoreductase subunit A